MILNLIKIKIILASTLLLLATSALSSEKNITYMQILQKPNDLDLNLKYAQQQGKMGNFKQTISTLERLTMLYPDNVEIKLYLLSVLVQVDSPEKANTIIEEMKLRKDLVQFGTEKNLFHFVLLFLKIVKRITICVLK